MKSEPQGPHVAFAVTALHGASGGAEHVLVDVANGLFRRGYRVTVLTYQERNGPSFYPLDYGITHLDGRRRHSRWRRGRPLAAFASVARRRRTIAVATWLVQHSPMVLRYRQLLRIARPDVAIGFLPSSFPYLIAAAIGTSVKTVASLHNVPDRDLGGDPERWDSNPVDIAIRRWSLRHSDANTVLLPSFIDQLDEDVRPKTFVVPNMIHPHFGPMADVRNDPNHNTILAVGRLAPAKDHATLIRAWAKLEDAFPTWSLRIVGRGPLFEDLSDLVERLGLTRVTLDEPTPDIDRVYTSSKFLVMSSLFEGFGLVTAEAMACGLPAIGFADCEGTNEIIVDGVNGLLVDPGSDRAAAIASAMRRLIEREDERVRLAAAGPATVQQYGPETVVDTWERVIHDVWSKDRSW